MERKKLSRDQYAIGWICALPIELAAATEMLDEIHHDLEDQDPSDKNSYTLGRIHSHNVVIACLYSGKYGAISAAMVAKDMLRSFSTSLRFGLMVGTGGGVPSPEHDIRLGDIVISQPTDTFGGVVQYDMGKVQQDGEFQRLGSLNSPPTAILAAIAKIKAKEFTDDPEYPKYMDKAIQRTPRTRRNFRRPETDRLFEPESEHIKGTSTCLNCTEEVVREEREEDWPYTHYGTIASGNAIIENATIREILKNDMGMLCLETEAAGLMLEFSCIVIRGICDYCDSHRNKNWHGYAAVAAAAYAKELLGYIPPSLVMREQLVSENFVELLVPELRKISTSIKDASKKDEVRYQSTQDMECHQILKTSSYEEFKNINPERVEGTCKWVLNHQRFQNWINSQNDDLLWISADPGCGKSVLSRSLVENELKSSDVLVTCYFFFKDNEAQNKLSVALCALLHQLLSQKPGLIHHCIPAFKRNGRELPTETEELWRALLQVSTDPELETVVCIIDALDECKLEDRKHLLRLLTKFSMRQSSSKLKFLVTSRPYYEIKTGWHGVPEGVSSIHIPGETMNQEIGAEINLVVDASVEKVSAELDLPMEVKDALKSGLKAGHHRTYLWLHLVIDEIRHQTTLKRTVKSFQQFLKKLPGTVDEAYESILRRNQTDDTKEETGLLLRIVLGAQRPLTLSEVQIALELALDPDLTYLADIDLETPGRFEIRIRELCGLFIFISDSLVHLIHQTAKEFLLQEKAHDIPAPEGWTWKQSIIEMHAGMVMTQVCMHYLLLRDLESLDGRNEAEYSSKLCLLKYAATNWPDHYRKVQNAELQCLLYFAFLLHVMTPFRPDLWWRIYCVKENLDGYHQGMNPIHFSAVCGHHDVLHLICQTVDGSEQFDTAEKHGKTPIMLAIQRGRTKAVEAILENGVDLEARDKEGRTILSQAIWRGDRRIIDLILQMGPVLETIDESGNTPLSLTLSFGQPNIMRALLENERRRKIGFNSGTVSVSVPVPAQMKVNLKSKSNYRQYAQLSYQRTKNNILIAAVTKGQFDIAQLVLQVGADTETGTEAGTKFQDTMNSSTPLMIAARAHRADIVELLLQAGANIEATDFAGQSPLLSSIRSQSGSDFDDLQYATKMRQTVMLLLQYGANIEFHDQHNCLTSLALAAMERRLEIVEILLQAGANTEAKDIVGRTPLLISISSLVNLQYTEEEVYARDQVVLLLLRHGANTNAQDDLKNTPLMRAISLGHLDLAHILVQNSAVMTRRDVHHMFMSAVSDENLEVVKFILQNGAGLQTQDNDTTVSLLMDALKDDLKMKKDRPMSADDFANSLDITTLENRPSFESSHIRGSGQCDAVSVKEIFLLVVAFKGYQETVKSIIGIGVDIETQDVNGKTPLMLATLNGHLEVVKLLLNKTDLEAQDESGMTSIILGTMDFHIKLLALHAKRTDKFHDSGRYDLWEYRNMFKYRSNDAQAYQAGVEKYGHAGRCLMLAAAELDVEMAQYIIERSAILKTSGQYNWKSLKHLVSECHQDISSLVAQESSHANITGEIEAIDEVSSWMLRYHQPTVKFLLQYGAADEPQHNHGQVTTWGAIGKMLLKLIDSLVRHGIFSKSYGLESAFKDKVRSENRMEEIMEEANYIFYEKEELEDTLVTDILKCARQLADEVAKELQMKTSFKNKPLQKQTDE